MVLKTGGSVSNSWKLFTYPNQLDVVCPFDSYFCKTYPNFLPSSIPISLRLILILSSLGLPSGLDLKALLLTFILTTCSHSPRFNNTDNVRLQWMVHITEFLVMKLSPFIHLKAHLFSIMLFLYLVIRVGLHF